MRSDLVVYVVVGIFVILLILLPRWLWRRGQRVPTPSKRTRAKREPKPFAANRVTTLFTSVRNEADRVGPS